MVCECKRTVCQMNQFSLIASLRVINTPITCLVNSRLLSIDEACSYFTPRRWEPLFYISFDIITKNLVGTSKFNQIFVSSLGIQSTTNERGPQTRKLFWLVWYFFIFFSFTFFLTNLSYFEFHFFPSFFVFSIFFGGYTCLKPQKVSLN